MAVFVTKENYVYSHIQLPVRLARSEEFLSGARRCYRIITTEVLPLGAALSWVVFQKLSLILDLRVSFDGE